MLLCTLCGKVVPNAEKYATYGDRSTYAAIMKCYLCDANARTVMVRASRDVVNDHMTDELENLIRDFKEGKTRKGSYAKALYRM